MIAELLKEIPGKFANSDKVLTVLTGAGISAESGIPTFRGPEGYWTIGSNVYQPQEIATATMFNRFPGEVWRWYLYRRGICRAAQPNAGHLALVKLEQKLGDRFTLITQNVDGLHLRAGNSPERMYQIHGNINFMRCSQACTSQIYPLPETVQKQRKEDTLTPADKEALRCPQCKASTRPHVLWFDEFYNEPHYRIESSLRVAERTDLLLIVGTAGATNLPHLVVDQVAGNGGMLIDVNVQENVFSRIARQHNGYFLAGPSGEILPELVEYLVT